MTLARRENDFHRLARTCPNAGTQARDDQRIDDFIGHQHDAARGQLVEARLEMSRGCAGYDGNRVGSIAERDHDGIERRHRQHVVDEIVDRARGGVDDGMGLGATAMAFVSAEAALSYLGISIHPPTPTLGNILRDSLSYAQHDFVFFFVPAFMIALIVVTFNLLGDGLRDALDPKGHS